jgi:hypothetical protein
VLASAVIARSVSECEKDLVIKSQDDIKSVEGCHNYFGDIILSDELSGSLDLNGIFARDESGVHFTAYQGNVTNVECSDDGSCYTHKPNLTSLTVQSFSVESLSLHGLTELTSLTFPETFSFGSLVLSDLPNLENFNITTQGFSREPEGLYIADEFHLSKLPKLESVSSTGIVSMNGNMSLDEVPLKNTRFSLYGGGYAVRELEIHDDKHIQHLSIQNYYPPGGASRFSDNRLWYFAVTGTGNTSLSMDTSKEYDAYSSPRPWNISLSGLSSLDYMRSDWDGLVADDFHIYATNIEELDLKLHEATRLRITDNPALKTILFPTEFANIDFQEIDISRNPMLKLEAGYSPKTFTDGGRVPYDSQDGRDTFFWPARNVQTMTFEGNFGSDFL